MRTIQIAKFLVAVRDLLLYKFQHQRTYHRPAFTATLSFYGRLALCLLLRFTRGVFIFFALYFLDL